MTKTALRAAAPSQAEKSGQFKICGEVEVNRLGFGAMRVTGDGVGESRPTAARPFGR